MVEVEAQMPKWLHRKKGSPYWHYDFVINGDRVHGSTKTDKPALARKIVERERAKALLGKLDKAAEEMTIDIAAGRWLDEVGDHLKEAANFPARFRRLIERLGKDCLLSEITAERLASYVGWCRAQVSATAANHDLATLRRVLSRAAKVWKAAVPTDLPWRDLTLPERALRQRHLSPEEEGRLLDVLPPDFAAVVRFAILTGARLDTILRLRWQDVDQAAGIVTLQDVKSSREGEKHNLPLTADVRALLAGRCGQHAEFVFSYLCQRTTRDRGGGKVEAGMRYPFSDTGWRGMWKRALAKAKIADFRFHDLRHTAATRITNATGNLRITQRLLGHASILTTQRYAHVVLDDVAQAMDAVSRNLPEGVSRRAPTHRLTVCNFSENAEESDDRTQAPKAGALPG